MTQTVNKEASEILQKGLRDLQCDLSVSQQEKLLHFVSILAEWNRVHNLTAISDPKEMITHHLLDSLSVLPYLKGKTLLDVGSGAGLPGIPLAIVRSDLNIVLIDSSQKKVHFLHHVIATLSLSNVTAIHQRVEDYKEHTFDIVISRAFSSLEQFLAKTDHLCQKTGTWIAMKGKVPEEELKALPKAYKVSKLQPVEVPGLLHRCLLFIHRNVV